MDYYCDIENRSKKEIAPGVNARTFWGDKMMLVTVVVDPGAVVPMHQHPQEQCGTVVAGEITFTIDGETRLLKVGDCYIIPGSAAHSAVGGAAGARLVEVFSPVREDLKYE